MREVDAEEMNSKVSKACDPRAHTIYEALMHYSGSICSAAGSGLRVIHAWRKSRGPASGEVCGEVNRREYARRR